MQPSRTDEIFLVVTIGRYLTRYSIVNNGKPKSWSDVLLPVSIVPTNPTYFIKIFA